MLIWYLNRLLLRMIKYLQLPCRDYESDYSKSISTIGEFPRPLSDLDYFRTRSIFHPTCMLEKFHKCPMYSMIIALTDERHPPRQTNRHNMVLSLSDLNPNFIICRSQPTILPSLKNYFVVVLRDAMQVRYQRSKFCLYFFVSPSVRQTDACFVTNWKNLLPTFWHQIKSECLWSSDVNNSWWGTSST